MAIEPGQQVPSGACTRVGNFPFSMLQLTNGVRTYPSYFGPILPQVDDIGALPPGTTEKQRYRDAFTENGLTVCDVDHFAIKHTPLTLSLGRTPSLIITQGAGGYSVAAAGPALYTGDGWEKRLQQSSYIQDLGGSGNVSFDLQNGPGIIYDWYGTGVLGSYYINQIFSCIATVNYSVDDLFADLPVITVVVSITFSNDGGTTTVSNSTSGVVSVRGGASESFSEPWLNNILVPGFLSRSANFSISISRAWDFPAPP